MAQTVLAYQKTYAEIIDTEHGRAALDATRQAVASFGREFTSMEAINAACTIRGAIDTWNVLNALDHLVTEGVLRELTDRYAVMGQDRRYVMA